MLLQVKKFSEKLFLPLARKIKKIPANVFTSLGLFFAFLTFIGFLFQFLMFIIICLFITEFFDQLDGVVARLQGPTKLGSFLDSTLDRIGDFLIFSGVILGGYTTIEVGLITFVGVFLTSYTRAKIEALGIDNLYGVGLLERTDRVPILLIGTIFQLWFPTAIWWTMIILAVGTNVTVIQRIMFAFNNFSKRKQNQKSV
ncbi:MAG: CDP-alcohol phosphatidyltransferase family protein [Promethearchaeota archaeon]|jgi:phosphatidylglycerophosphate synthase